MLDEWRDIEGYPKYQINDVGTVMSSNKHRPSQLKPETDKDGYKRVVLCRNGEKRKFLIHRLVLLAFEGKPPSANYNVTRHLNDIPCDNNINNIVWGTVIENVKDRDNHKRTCLGSRQHLSKLKETDISFIRKMISDGKTNLEIANQYNVSAGAIWFIKSGRTWKHC